MSDPRTWLPFDYMDEVLPPPRGSPAAWLTRREREPRSEV